MKYILLLSVFLTSCSNIYSEGNKVTGSWIRIYEDGRLESVSLYPNNWIKINGDFAYKWKSEGEKVIILGEKSTIVGVAILSKSTLLISDKVDDDNYWTKWFAMKLSDNPDEQVDLYQVCNNSQELNIWSCSNIGKGEKCKAYYPAPEITSLRLDTCQKQCEELVAYRAEHYPKLKNLEKCLLKQ